MSALPLLLGAALLTAAYAEELEIAGPIPEEVQEIDITYIDGQQPKVSFMSSAVQRSDSRFTPSGDHFDLLSSIGRISSFGNCATLSNRKTDLLTLKVKKTGEGPCGQVLWLKDSSMLDALAYDTLSLRGASTGSLTLALADEAHHRREDHVAVAHLNGRFDLRIPLQSVARRLDLGRLTSLVVLPHAADTTLTLEALSLRRTVSPHRTIPRLGFWVWDYRHALADQHSLISECRRQGCSRLLIQIPGLNDGQDIWIAYAKLLDAAGAAGIEAFALDGYPEAIRDPAALIEKLTRLLALLPKDRLSGVQLDIEPYLLPDFSEESDYLAYLAAVDRIKNTLDGRVRLSVVMPFWLTSKIVNGRPVAFSVMDRADEVAIMSYRTDLDELHALAKDSLRYGDLNGVPVWLAVETRPLPIERHVLLKRERRPELMEAYLDRRNRRLVLIPPASIEADGFRLMHRTVVRPDRLTFARRTRKDVMTAVAMIQAFPNPSLAGVLIHDLSGFLSLPE